VKEMRDMKKYAEKWIHVTIVAFTACFLGFTPYARGAAYYVDFENGSDSNAGTSTSVPWKHSPGDGNAISNAATVVLQPGDSVNFKGGAKYKGKIDLLRQGTVNNSIAFNGNSGWGTGKAIIDGSVSVAWQPCSSLADCGNNENWASMYYAMLPTGSNWTIPVFDSDKWMYYAQSSVQLEPFFYGDTEYYHSLTSGITATQLTDSSVLNQIDENFWKGGYVIVHISGNSLGYGKISSYSPSTNTITYASVGTPYQASDWDNKYHYSIINVVRKIDAPGKYAVDESAARIYVWPKTNIANLTVGSLTYGFNTNGQSYITIDGFIIQGQYGISYVGGRAITGSTSTATNGNVIQYCEIRNSVGNGATAATYMKGGGGTPNTVQNNYYSYIYGRGSFGTDDKVYVLNNKYEYLTGTVIYFQNSPTSGAINGRIMGNYINHCKGVHQNGITVYGTSAQPSRSFIISGNKVLNFVQRFGPYSMSAQLHYDFTVYNNIFEGQYADDGPPPTGCTYMRYYNNTYVDPMHTAKAFRASAPQLCAEFTVKGNIIDGLLGPSNQWSKITHENNIYTSLAWTQDANYGWTIDSSESVKTREVIFNNPSKHDYTLATNSPAIGALPIVKAPTALFNIDILGRGRTNSLTWDVGPYEGLAKDMNSPSSLRIR
jgi:hypothetical protein